MEELTEWEVYDRILKFLVVNKKHTNTSVDIQREVFPGLNTGIVQGFVNKLPTISTTFPIVIYSKYGGGALKATDFTQIFLEGGGFVKEHEKAMQLRGEHEYASEKSMEKLDLELIDLNNKIKDYDQTKKFARDADARSKDSLFWSKAAVVISGLSVLIIVSIELLKAKKIWPFDH